MTQWNTRTATCNQKVLWSASRWGIWLNYFFIRLKASASKTPLSSSKAVTAWYSYLTSFTNSRGGTFPALFTDSYALLTDTQMQNSRFIAIPIALKTWYLFSLDLKVEPVDWRIFGISKEITQYLKLNSQCRMRVPALKKKVVTPISIASYSVLFVCIDVFSIPSPTASKAVLMSVTMSIAHRYKRKRNL